MKLIPLPYPYMCPHTGTNYVFVCGLTPNKGLDKTMHIIVSIDPPPPTHTGSPMSLLKPPSRKLNAFIIMLNAIPHSTSGHVPSALIIL